jgi:hypothetical protein
MKTSELPVIDCPTEPRLRGRAHGEALRAVIGAKIERWHAAIELSYHQASGPFLTRFLAETDFRKAAAEYVPDMLEEVQGIAEGAGIAEETAFALQLMDEEWWYGKAGHDGHCSSFSAVSAGRGSVLMGQTMDLPAWHDGAQALLGFRNPDGRSTNVFTSAGMVGLMGVSDGGIGICVNTLSSLRSNPHGLPVAFVMRSALARKTVSDAAAFLRDVPHASGQNYQLGDRRTIADFECSAEGAAGVPAHADLILHTNHPLASVDIGPESVGKPVSPDSRDRLAHLADGLPTAGLDASDARQALSARGPAGSISIERDGSGSLVQLMTIGAVVYEIAAETKLWVAAGPPSRESWRAFPPTGSPTA